MEPILEFKNEFGKKDYYLYLQIKKESIFIGIETEAENNDILYWKKNLDNETIKETTSQMGSFKSLQSFGEMLIDGLSRKNNLNSTTIDFCSLNEIRELAENDNNIKPKKKFRFTQKHKSHKKMIVNKISLQYNQENTDINSNLNTNINTDYNNNNITIKSKTSEPSNHYQNLYL